MAGNPLSSIDPTGLSSKGATADSGTHISGIDGCEHPNSERLQIGPGIFRPSNWFSKTWKEKLHWIRVHDTNRIKLVDDSFGAAFWNDGFTTNNVLTGLQYGALIDSFIASGGTATAGFGVLSSAAGVGAVATDGKPCARDRAVLAAGVGMLGTGGVVGSLQAAGQTFGANAAARALDVGAQGISVKC